MADNKKQYDSSSFALDMIKRIFAGTSMIFTVLYILFLAVVGGFSLSSGMNFKESLLVLLSSFIIALSLETFRIKSLSTPIKTLINYGIILLSFFIVFVTAGKIVTPTPAKIIVIIFLVTLVYAVVYALCILIKRKKASISKQYTTQPISKKAGKTETDNDKKPKCDRTNNSESSYTDRFR